MKSWKFLILLLIILLVGIGLFFFLLPGETRSYIFLRLTQLGTFIFSAAENAIVLLSIFAFGLIMGILAFFGIQLIDRVVDTDRELTGRQIDFVIVGLGLVVFVFQLLIMILASQRPETWIQALTTIFGLWVPASGNNRIILVLWGAYGFITYLIGYFAVSRFMNRR